MAQELERLTSVLREQERFASKQSMEWNAAAQSGDQQRMVYVAITHMGSGLPALLNLVSKQTDVSLNALGHAVAAIQCLVNESTGG